MHDERSDLDLSRFDAAPLIAFTATKEIYYGTETDGRIPRWCGAYRADKWAYLHARETGSEAKAGVRKWIDFYNCKRPHFALCGKPPAVVCWQRNETTNPDQQQQKEAKVTPDPVQ